MGGSVPWDVVDAKFMRGRKPVLRLRDHIARLVVSILQFVIGLGVAILAGAASATVALRKGKLHKVLSVIRKQNILRHDFSLKVRRLKVSYKDSETTLGFH